MNMVGVVLRVVVLHQKSRTLNTVVVAVAPLQAIRPSKGDRVDARLADRGKAGGGEVLGHLRSVDVDQAEQEAALVGTEPRRADTDRREGVDVEIGAGNDVVGCVGGDDGDCALGRVERLHELTGDILPLAEDA